MNVFEKIIEKLEKYPAYSFGVSLANAKDYIKVNDLMSILQEVAEEHNNGWIPCSKQLPEESLNSVLGWDEYRWRCCFAQYYDGRWHIGNDLESVNIIAWQPLPVPYKPEGE